MNKRTLLIAAAGAAAILIWLSLAYEGAAAPAFEQVRGSQRRSDAVLLDRHGEIIHEQRILSDGRKLDWVPLEQISPLLVSTMLFAEDKRFFSHKGIDWQALLGSGARSLLSGKPRGASTITMQLAALLDHGLKPKKSRRSLKQKLAHLSVARSIEKTWTKNEILEAYLNLMSFRGELQGISAASRGLFRKEPHGLNRDEALLLACLPRAPGASAEQIASRAEHLASAMGSNPDPQKLRDLARQSLTGPYLIKPMAALAPQIASKLLPPPSAQSGISVSSVATTLDTELQRFTIEALKAQIRTLQAQNVQDAAAIITHNETGDILAYVGNVRETNNASYVDGAMARRQAGSTLKPFVYALAFDKRILTPASLLDDSPLNIPIGNSIFSPQNYDKQFHGLIPARVALASSVNVPAVKTLLLVGVEQFLSKLSQAGFGELNSAEFYGPSLALGTADVTLWELVDAYRMLANGGVWSPLRITPWTATAKPQRVFSKEAVFLVSDILSDRESRSATFGLESVLSTRYWTAVKTGTSKDMRDNWCIGYSDSYTVGVWVGNFSGKPMWDVSGMSGAAPAWVEIMNWLHRSRTSKAPPPPKGVIQKETAAHRNEWFLRGTEPQFASGIAEHKAAQISYPPDGSIFGLDPDIPTGQQALFFEANAKDSKLRWVLDQTEIGTTAEQPGWTLLPGKHTLYLKDNENRVLDTVHFEVRGNAAQ